ncbi:MAG: SRPBCC family protein [Deltaproteobacteria bacterium]|nr:SRPBCC family protein [Deltaproteobacteria bacterium]
MPTVISKATIEIQGHPPEVVFDAVTALENLPASLTSYGPIPAILSASIEGADQTTEGCTRVTTNSDGSTIRELIVKHQRPSLHSYQITSGLKPPLTWLVSSAGGTWSIVSTTNGTRITWEFTFTCRGGVTAQLFRLFVLPKFQKAQEICLSNHKRRIENHEC